jgi:UDP-glucose 4-epimerase
VDVEEITRAVCHERIDFTSPKKIMIAGTGSYIGESFKKYMSHFGNYVIDSFKTRNNEWEKIDFSGYDVVLDVAGIVNAKVTNENRRLFYEVNKDLAVKIAKKAKTEGVKQFIYLSSMLVYSLDDKYIDENTELKPANIYGDSKLQAEKQLWKLRDDNFIVSIVRPPMVYGKGCKGNYQTLRKFALKFGFFPKYDNERSMIYIDNLSSSIRGIIHNEESGVYFPQNKEYFRTYDMVRWIAEENGKKFKSTKIINHPIKVATARIGIFKKVFGTRIYSQDMNVPREWLQIENNYESIKRTEGEI